MKEDESWIGSIGITLTNGSSSPMFTGLKEEKLAETKEIKITQQIKTVVGTSYPLDLMALSFLGNLSFKNDEDQ